MPFVSTLARLENVEAYHESIAPISFLVRRPQSFDIEFLPHFRRRGF